MNSPTKLIPLILIIMMSATIPVSASPNCGVCERPNYPTLIRSGIPCRPKTAGTAIPGEDCKECDGNGGVDDRADQTPCSGGFVCCKGVCFGIPQHCGECKKPSDCLAYSLGAPMCVPDNGAKCKQDKCVRGPGIQGAQLRLTPSARQVCKNEPISVDTGTPTDEDYLFTYKCKNGLCQLTRTLISGTVKTGKVEIEEMDARRGLATRTYTVVFTSECGDLPVRIRERKFILDCPKNLKECQEDCEKSLNPDYIAGCNYGCALSYLSCRHKCLQYGF